MFPQLQEDEVTCLLGLANGNEYKVITLCLEGLSVSKLLRLFKSSKMKTKVKKVTVSCDSIIYDALAIYKSPKFDISRPIEVELIGSQAIDLGGPRRQFFTSVLDGLAKNDKLTLFEGDYDSANLLPCVNHDAVISGIFKMVGKIIVHSILMEGPGFPFLPLPIYRYMVTGCINSALPHLSISHLPPRARAVVDQVNV